MKPGQILDRYLDFTKSSAYAMLTRGRTPPCSGANHGRSHGRQPYVAVGPSGQVACSFVVSTGVPGASQSIYVASNTNGLANPQAWTVTNVVNPNLTWGQSIPAQPNRRLFEDAVLAFDRSNSTNRGRLYLAYTDYPSGGTADNTDIWLRYSDQWGLFWPSSNTNSVNNASARSQFLPAIPVDPTSGNLAIAWHDCRNDPQNTNTQSFAAISRKGGTNFDSNFQVCPGSSNANNLPASPFQFDYGDFTGLDYYGGTLHFGWADNSNSTGDNPDGNTRMDIYTCTIKY